MKYKSRARGRGILAALGALLLILAVTMPFGGGTRAYAADTVIPVPPAPRVVDDPNVCGDAHYVLPKNTDQYVWGLEADGSATVGTLPGYIFEGGNRSVVFPPPADKCPEPDPDPSTPPSPDPSEPPAPDPDPSTPPSPDPSEPPRVDPVPKDDGPDTHRSVKASDDDVKIGPPGDEGGLNPFTVAGSLGLSAVGLMALLSVARKRRPTL